MFSAFPQKEENQNGRRPPRVHCTQDRRHVWIESKLVAAIFPESSYHRPLPQCTRPSQRVPPNRRRDAIKDTASIVVLARMEKELTVHVHDAHNYLEAVPTQSLQWEVADGRVWCTLGHVCGHSWVLDWILSFAGSCFRQESLGNYRRNKKTISGPSLHLFNLRLLVAHVIDILHGVD